jgi:hypothetical protein
MLVQLVALLVSGSNPFLAPKRQNLPDLPILQASLAVREPSDMGEKQEPPRVIRTLTSCPWD